MQKYNKESLKQEKTRVNQLLDQENRICAKCKDKKEKGCEHCFHEKRKQALQKKKEEVTAAQAAQK
jgi:hypothetical protein